MPAALLFWKEDRILGHNLWRRLLLDYYSPRPGGELLRAPLCHRSWGKWTAEEQIARINWWAEHNLPMECYWIDIGWERPPTEKETRDHLANCVRKAHRRQRLSVANERLFPDGLRPISDAAHKHGMKFLLWFGQDRLYPNLERVRKERPDLLSPEHPGTDNGNPKITQWMIEHFSEKIRDWGIDIFRQDGRSTPPKDSSPNRLGINSARSAEGFCTFWDALLGRFPNLIIDNCCGGGRNIDLETVRRSIALWRSDYQIPLDFDPIGMQCQTHSLSSWAPLSAGVCNQGGGQQPNLYAFRSGYGPAMRVGWYKDDGGLPTEGFDFDLARKLLNEYLSVRHYFYGDYYPLTRYSLDKDVWMAWQFDRPDIGEGIMQAFRRPESPYESARFNLGGLDPDARYKVTNVDAQGSKEMTGRELMEKGLPIGIPNRPGAAVVTYKKAK